jgi:protein-S-isoprenylcysteine O-methyltransferase Ste14
MEHWKEDQAKGDRFCVLKPSGWCRETKDLNIKALGGLLFLVICLAAAMFLPAWTVHYWQAWTFLAVFTVSVLAITVYLMKKDPKLLERRVNAGPGAEKKNSQKIIQFFAQIAFLAVLVIPSVDHRFAWSTVPPYISVAGDALVVLGLLVVFLVFKENTFTSAIIEVSAEQKVISTGPYALVRHPMYIGALVMLLGVPLALGSWWGLLTIIPMAVVIILRLLDEEKYLIKILPGYDEYRHKVKYRLAPFIW